MEYIFYFLAIKGLTLAITWFTPQYKEGDLETGSLVLDIVAGGGFVIYYVLKGLGLL